MVNENEIVLVYYGLEYCYGFLVVCFFWWKLI